MEDWLARAKHYLKLSILWVARAMGIYRLARWITRNGFVIVGWHGVSSHGEHLRIPSYSITPEQLETRLMHLSRHFRMITLQEAIAQHIRGEIQPRQVVLTFDDGMKSFISSAKPILDRYHAPATVYALSSSVEKQLQSYPLLIRDLFHLSRKAACELPGPLPTMRCSLSTPQDREKAASAAIQRFTEIAAGDSARKRYVLELANELQVNIEKLECDKTWYYMQAEDLAAISRDGVSIQVHSHSHLNCVKDLPDVYEDTVKCRRLLESVTQSEASHYCYPSGFWSKEVWPELRRAGIVSAVTCNTGPNYVTTPILALRRFIDHHCVTQLEFEFAVSGLRWLIHRIAHPLRSQTPFERRVQQGPTF